MKLKKSLIITLLICLLSIFTAFIFTACKNTVSKDENDVWTYERVYARARELGFEGTLDELIDSLKGADGKDGKDGVGIKSIAVNADGELVITLTGDVVLNLGNIKGADGKDGKDLTACDHKYSQWAVVVAPTCTSIGYSTRECSACGDVDYQFSEAIGHEWEEGYVLLKPNCVEAGVKLFTCEVCQTAKYEKTPELGHDYVLGKCSRCGDKISSDGLLYELSDDGTYYRLYSMGNCREEDIVIASTYKGLPVKEIGENAFKDNGIIKTVKIPDSVTLIGENAFYSCYSITSVTIGNGVISIGKSAFYGCNRIKSLIIPNSVTSIGESAFVSCTNLTYVTIGTNVTSIGENAFGSCYKLIEVYNLSSLNIVKGSGTCGRVALYAQNVYTATSGSSKIKTQNGFVFYEDGATVYLIEYDGNDSELTLPEKFNGKNYSIYEYAFCRYRGVTRLTIPNGVTSIGYMAFMYCSRLTSVTIGSGVTEIGFQAFFACLKLIEVCNLSSLNIAKGVQDLGNVAYYAQNVYTATSGSSKIKTQNGFVFYEDGATVYLIGYEGNDSELTLPENFNGKNYSIYNYALCYCESITSVNIPDGITSISDRAFYYCSSLESIVIPDSVTSIGAGAFLNCTSLERVYYGGTEEDWKEIVISTGNEKLESVAIYYFSEGNPFGDTATEGNFWHYDEDGEIAIWSKEN